MAEVFLSYAREDRARAELVARGLAAAGVEVFWDNEIPPGQTWADYIETKLAQCKALIVLWSETSTKSQWVREEARLGRDKGVLIPAMIDVCQAPFGFGEVQAANLADWNGEAEHPTWRRFVEAVRTANNNPAPSRPAPQAAMSAPPRAAAAPREERKKGVPVWIWVVGSVVATVVALGIYGSTLPSTPAASNPTPDKPANEAPAPAPTPAPQAPGDQNPQAIILAQLQQAEAAFAQQGFQQMGQPFSGSLAQGQTWNVPAQLQVGVDYRVIGVCDRDCGDLDLVLYDANGGALTQDTTTTSQPVLAMVPGYTGNYAIQVQMYNCTVAPCYYALALYGRAIQ